VLYVSANEGIWLIDLNSPTLELELVLPTALHQPQGLLINKREKAFIICEGGIYIRQRPQIPIPYPIYRPISPPRAYIPERVLRFDNARQIKWFNGSLLVSSNCSHLSLLSPDGKPTLLAGVPYCAGYRDGDARQALFSSTGGMAVLDGMTIIVTDSNNHCLRIVTGSIVQTLAGKPNCPGHRDGPIQNALFNTPSDVIHQAQMNILFVADTMNHCVRIVDLHRRTVSTISGEFETEQGLKFKAPLALQLYGTKLFVADFEDAAVHVVDVSDCASTESLLSSD